MLERFTITPNNLLSSASKSAGSVLFSNPVILSKISNFSSCVSSLSSPS